MTRKILTAAALALTLFAIAAYSFAGSNCNMTEGAKDGKGSCCKSKEAKAEAVKDGSCNMSADGKCSMSKDGKCACGEKCNMSKDGKCNMSKDGKCDKSKDGKCNMSKDGKCNMSKDGKCACGDKCGMSKDGTCGKTASKDPTAQDVVIDPVCGMDVSVSESKFSSEYKGKTYHFCNESCKKSFDKDPSKFIGKDKK